MFNFRFRSLLNIRIFVTNDKLTSVIYSVPATKLVYSKIREKTKEYICNLLTIPAFLRHYLRSDINGDYHRMLLRVTGSNLFL
ncbi:LOW QUALITY PROTEIN: hypothetical protein HZS_8059 [Henneguya salminicola]|nr:LOW QUALITY PROTEIN: hypothetical protein HZS_8059 [Henneguya salminicola]